jgi:transposase
MPELVESAQRSLGVEAEGPGPEPEPAPNAVGPEGAPRFQAVNRNQFLWHAVDVERLVAPDHLVRALWELTGQLDLSGFSAGVKAVDGVAGRPAYDPRLLISLWVYAYSQKISSAREVERRCGYDPAFQWLTGMEEVNHHTLSDFRIQHQEALDKLFTQLLAALEEQDLITLERVAHDGTKVKAAAAGNSFHREKTLRDHVEAARERVRAMGDPRDEEPSRRVARARERAAREKVERLEQALEEIQKVQAAAEARAEKSERRVSETDPEARVMKQGDGGHAPSHNVQISTDTAHGIIVGVSVTQAANDQHEMVPAVEEVKRRMGRPPEHLVVDDGYTTRENVVAAAERGWDLIGGTMQGNAKDAQAATRRLEQRGVDPAFYPENFGYDPATNSYTCPAGKPLPYQTTKHDRVGVERHVYKARAADCRTCAFQKQCSPGKHGRHIVRSEMVPAVAAYVARRQTEEAQALYRLRAPVAEFSNLWLKTKLGLRQFCVRGLKKVRCEALWACLTYNVQQWFRLRWKPKLMSAQG